jgi:hypothetical protein
MAKFADGLASGGDHNMLNRAQLKGLMEWRVNLRKEIHENLGHLAHAHLLKLEVATLRDLTTIYHDALMAGLFIGQSPVRTRNVLRERLASSEILVADDLKVWCENRPDADAIREFSDTYFPKLCRLIDMDIGQRIDSSPTVGQRS